jgi:hypothetical protein
MSYDLLVKMEDISTGMTITIFESKEEGSMRLK